MAEATPTKITSNIRNGNVAGHNPQRSRCR